MNTIRKISVGSNYPNGALHYQVGNIQKLGGSEYKIKSITSEYELSGEVKYSIVIESLTDGSNVVWKEIIGLPVVVEYSIDFE